MKGSSLVCSQAQYMAKPCPWVNGVGLRGLREPLEALEKLRELLMFHV